MSAPSGSSPGALTRAAGTVTRELATRWRGTYGVVALIVAGIFLSLAMGRTATWPGWAWPTRWTMVLLFGAAFADAIGQHYGLGGLFERLIAVVGAIWIGSLAVAILRRTGKAPAGQ